jgi:site-specific DNA-methyltransferase (adenine-specific)
MAKQLGQQHIPDILDCLAQLSNDEVPTPPKLARAMLDILPAEVWSDPELKWLDPFCKSGVFLREVAIRLLDGLAEWEPDFDKRREHIYRNMLFGTSITEMTGIISRRTLYCSRDASGDHSIVRFHNEPGNLSFVPAKHIFGNGGKAKSCDVCGAPSDLERGDKRENYAYSFIHDAYPTEEMKRMKFDVIVGNPPYQIDSDGNTRTRPVYQHFVRKAIEMAPRYVLMITPSRWFTGGLGLDDYRSEMVADRRIARIVDNPKLFDCFPGVEIKGGVSYFLWDREHNGDCEFSTRVDGVIISTRTRDLRKGDGVLIRSNEGEEVLNRVREAGDVSVAHRISAQAPFELRSNFKGHSAQPFPDAIRLYVRGLEPAWINRSEITKNTGLIDQHKVLTPKAADGHGRIPATVTGVPIVASPPSACTMTYLVAGTWPTEAEASNFAVYLRTKFVRFLISLRKVSQDVTWDRFSFVPDLPMDQEWTDEALYARYRLTGDEIAYIESQIKEMSALKKVKATK